jgi:hypothetical protein
MRAFPPLVLQSVREDVVMSSNRKQQLRRLVDEDDHAIYEAVKAGKVSELPHEDQLQAKAMEEHLDLPGVHNALEFADLREGQPFEMEASGHPLSPLAHITVHAVVLSMLEENSDARAAFERLTKEKSVSEHHAIHVLGSLFFGFYLVAGRGRSALEKDDRDLYRGDFEDALKRICRDPRYRYKVIQKFPPSHWE